MVMGAMARSRWIALAVLSATFAAGAMLGAAGYRVYANEQPDRRPPARAGEARDERGPRTSIFDQIGLTPEQRAAVDSIMEKRRRDMDAFWKEHNPRLRALVDSAKAEIDRLLTDEQRQQLEEWRERRRPEPPGRDRRDGRHPPPNDSVRGQVSYSEPRYI